MQLLILRLLLRKLIVSVCILAVCALSPIGALGYLAVGVLTAIVLAPTMWAKLKPRASSPTAYTKARALAFTIDTLTWPDSILTQILRASHLNQESKCLSR
jgi:hypothetical protein